MIKSLPDFVLRRKSEPLNCDEPLITDQSDTPMTEINNILKQYQQTGMLPGTSNHQMEYADDVNRPSFMDAHEKLVFAREEFAKLPQNLRNELNNNPANFETWLSDPDNTERAIKLGLLVKKPDPSNLKADTTQNLKTDNPAQSKVDTQETPAKPV